VPLSLTVPFPPYREERERNAHPAVLNLMESRKEGKKRASEDTLKNEYSRNFKQPVRSKAETLDQSVARPLG
jgi:hypothetical protein